MRRLSIPHCSTENIAIVTPYKLLTGKTQDCYEELLCNATRYLLDVQYFRLLSLISLVLQVMATELRKVVPKPFVAFSQPLQLVMISELLGQLFMPWEIKAPCGL